MKVLIDASNISSGGGLTHLSQVLNAFDSGHFPHIENITIYSSQKTLDTLQKNRIFAFKTNWFLERNILFRLFWQQLLLPFTARNFDILFSPGSTISFLTTVPKVTISQNLLPFEKAEYSRYSLFSKMRLKMFLLRQIQSLSFKRANGIIFLTKYAQTVINQIVKIRKSSQVIIPHGLEKRFYQPEKIHKSVFSEDDRCQVLYVSTVDRYKHQWNVVQAVDKCIEDGLFLDLTLIGSAEKTSHKLLQNTLEKSKNKKNLKYLGLVPYVQLHEYYYRSDIFIFASTCENLPNIMLESMASQLPIICSSYGPMPEVLKDNGCYFDPLSVDDLVQKIKMLYIDVDKRRNYAQEAYKDSQQYSWTLTSEKTFKFLTSFKRA